MGKIFKKKIGRICIIIHYFLFLLVQVFPLTFASYVFKKFILQKKHHFCNKIKSLVVTSLHVLPQDDYLDFYFFCVYIITHSGNIPNIHKQYRIEQIVVYS